MSNSRPDPLQASVAYQKAADPSSYVPVLVVIYEALLRHLDQARKEFESQDISQCSRTLGKVSQVLSGLQRNLRHDVAPTLAAQLSTFYDLNLIAVSTLVSVNFDRKAFDALTDRLTLMRDAWAEVAATDQPKSSGPNRNKSAGPPERIVKVV